MPPKRKASTKAPSAAAAAAASYTDASGALPNKRSRVSKPVPAPFPAKGPTKTTDENHIESSVANDEPQFDHSRPEERAGIVDRRFYPAEMSNERCAMYNNNEIPRPIENLNQKLEDTARSRERIAKGKGKDAGEAVMHWFKRDLRVRDNTGLSLAGKLAKEKGVGVIAVWLLSPQDWEAHLVSPAKCDFELRSVAVLKAELAKLDIPLYIEVVEKRRNVPTKLVELATKWGVKNVFCNLEYEPDELRREEKLVGLMLEEGINFSPQHDDCVVPPGSLKTGAGRQYAVYSPWFRNWISYVHAHPGLLQEQPLPPPNPPAFKEKYSHLFDSSTPPAPAPASKSLSPEEEQRIRKMWPAGEEAALDRLGHFLKEKIGKYHSTRNFPALNTTARISVHHAAGTLAARTSVRLARDVNSTKRLDGGIEGIKSWISEVAWRDFYRHVLVNWPYVW